MNRTKQEILDRIVAILVAAGYVVGYSILLIMCGLVIASAITLAILFVCVMLVADTLKKLVVIIISLIVLYAGVQILQYWEII